MNKSKPATQTVQPAGFKEDRRDDNPALHLHYTKQAVKHLRELQRMGKTLLEFSNGNMMGPYRALHEAYRTLIKENAAYADAHEILHSVGLAAYIKFDEDNAEG